MVETHILCPGELLIDAYYEGDETTYNIGGAPANAAKAMKQFGATPHICAVVGKDPEGDFLKKGVEKHGLDTSNVLRSKTKTTVVEITHDNSGEGSFSFQRGADKELRLENISSHLRDKCVAYHFGSATAFLGGDLEQTYWQLFHDAQREEKIISIDPNYRPTVHVNEKQTAYQRSAEENFAARMRDFIQKADILKVSEEEAKIISEKSDLENAINFFIDSGAANVFITLGKDGTQYVTRERTERIPSINVVAVDNVGAGDAFAGTLLAQLTQYSKEELRDPKMYDTIKEHVRVSNIAAAVTVTKQGAFESIPSKEEVEALVQQVA